MEGRQEMVHGNGMVNQQATSRFYCGIILSLMLLTLKTAWEVGWLRASLEELITLIATLQPTLCVKNLFRLPNYMPDIKKTFLIYITTYYLLQWHI